MRITLVTPGTRPEIAAQEAQIMAARGRISDLYQVLLNSPPIAHGWEQMLSAVRNKSSLPAALRELVIVRVAVLNKADFEYQAHVPIALREGATEAMIDAVTNAEYLAPMPADSGLSSSQQVALLLTDTMTRNIEVPDALFAQVRQYFDEQAQVDLVATIAAYNMVSRFLTAFHIGHGVVEIEQTMHTDFLLFQLQADTFSDPSQAVQLVTALKAFCDSQPIPMSVHRIAQTEQSAVYAYVRLAQPQSISLDTMTSLKAAFQLACGYPAHASRLQLALQPDSYSKHDKPQFHYVVETDTDEGWFERIADWYDQEHMPGLAAVPGTISAMRLLNLDATKGVDDNRPRSFACYDLTTPDVLTSAAWLAVRHTAWSDIARPHFTNTKRTLFKVIASTKGI
jgi:4-carboxymuconolactone decarboxylase